jgi:hypothetical protein
MIINADAWWTTQRGHAAICAAHPAIVMDFKTDQK